LLCKGRRDFDALNLLIYVDKVRLNLIVGIHSEIGKFGQDQGLFKILAQAYDRYSEVKILMVTQLSGELAIHGRELVKALYECLFAELDAKQHAVLINPNVAKA